MFFLAFLSRPWIRRLAGPLFVCGLLLLAPDLSFGQTETPAERMDFKLVFEESGVYRVLFEELVKAGFPSSGVSSHELALWSQGRDLPFWLEDAGDGHFGPGDHLEFIGQHLAGDASWFHPHSRLNVTWLEWSPLPGPRLKMWSASQSNKSAEEAAIWSKRHHLEAQNHPILGWKGDEAPDDYWFQAQLSAPGNPDLSIPLSQEVWPPGVPLGLELRLQGLSRLPRSLRKSTLPDHRLEAFMDQQPLGTLEWSGQEEQNWKIALPADFKGERKLHLQVSHRSHPESGHPLVDVILLDWLELTHPAAKKLSVGNQQLLVETSERPQSSAFELPRGVPGIFYLSNGQRLQCAPSTESQEACQLTVPSGVESLWSLVGEEWKVPLAILGDQPSNLRSRQQQADYLIVSHRDFLETLQPLVAYHQSRGLQTVLIDAQDVYDEYSDGIFTPVALRDFFKDAFRHWKRPAPAFALLVGDASWGLWESAVQDELSLRHALPVSEEKKKREFADYLPTWSKLTPRGFLLNDSYFVAFDKDLLPKLALGRLPVRSPKELQGILEKSFGYAQGTPLPKKLIWLTGQAKREQYAANELVPILEEEGWNSVVLQAQKGHAPKPTERELLLEEMKAGAFLLHFMGHGGRFVLRTADPASTHNRDLLHARDIKTLPPGWSLPVFISLSCSSAPFNHPTQDSLGEAMLRNREGGPIAVFAPSCRSSPTYDMNVALLEELKQEQPLGEAFRRAKSRFGRKTLLEDYNLLGDPALEIPRKSLGDH